MSYFWASLPRGLFGIEVLNGGIGSKDFDAFEEFRVAHQAAQQRFVLFHRSPTLDEDEVTFIVVTVKNFESRASIQRQAMFSALQNNPTGLVRFSVVRRDANYHDDAHRLAS